VRTLQAQAHLQAGRVRGGREHFEEAERLALSCLQIATPKGYVYRLAATARRGLGDLEGALAHLDASIARGLRAPEVRLDRAAVLRELGRPRDARQELFTAQREAPGDPAVMRALLQLASPPR
jgi:tetratricopeptide (TPR) repeat protein